MGEPQSAPRYGPPKATIIISTIIIDEAGQDHHNITATVHGPGGLMTMFQRCLTAGAVTLLLAVSSADAQQIILCHSLDNDLVNFDRRAHAVGGYYLPQIMKLQHAVAAAEAEYLDACVPGAATATDTDCRVLKTRIFYLREELRGWTLSPLGGSDPVRLRILLEMRRNGCPLPPGDPAAALLAENFAQPRAVRARMRAPRYQRMMD
jgi:hypothetical protein